MSLFRVVLIATDGSPQSGEVVATGRAVAERFEAQIHLYRAILIPSELPVATRRVDDLREFLVHQAETDLKRLARGSEEVVIHPIEVTPKRPWRLIVNVAKQIDADLIVVGSHGYSGWDRVIGTTAAQVADHSDRSVLIVHKRSSKST